MSPVSMSQSLEYFIILERFFSHVQLLVINSKPGGHLPTTIPMDNFTFPLYGKILNSKVLIKVVKKTNPTSKQLLLYSSLL